MPSETFHIFITISLCFGKNDIISYGALIAFAAAESTVNSSEMSGKSDVRKLLSPVETVLKGLFFVILSVL